MKLMKLVTLSLCLSLALGGSLAAQERLATKQLAGPIEEVRTGAMAPIDPKAAAIHSKSAMIAVDLERTESGSWRWQGKIAIDNDHFNMTLFSGDESWTVRLGSGDSKSLAPAHELATRFERASLALGNNAFEGDYYHFADVQPGQWAVTVETDATLEGRGYLLYSTDSDYRLLSHQTEGPQLLGNTIGFVSSGYRQAREGLGEKADGGRVEESWLRVTTPDGREMIHAMYDDGRHDDGRAGDGIFGGSFTAAQVGDYLAQVVARGTTPEGRPFLRTAEHIVPIIAPEIGLAFDVAAARLVDDKRLEISLAVHSLATAPEKYRVIAEVWGADGEGAMQPVS